MAVPSCAISRSRQGAYVIALGVPADAPQPWIVTASPEAGALADPEPDDTPQTAIPLDPSDRVATGRLGWDGDVDNYLLHVDDRLASLLLDVKLLWRRRPGRPAMPGGRHRHPAVCRTGAGGDALANLFLPVGDYTPGGRAETPIPRSPTCCAIDQTSAPAPDFETEPNDTAATARPGRPGVLMRGRDCRRRRLLPAHGRGRTAAVAADRDRHTSTG